MSTARGRTRSGLLLILLLSIQHEVVVAYVDEEVTIVTSGFHVGDIQHEVATNQIVMQLTLSCSVDTIPILYLSREGWDSIHPYSDKVHNHPCEGGALANNNICCLNALLEQYQVGPSLLNLHENMGICPRDVETGAWVQNYTTVSTENAQLSVHTMRDGVGNLDFLSTGIEHGPPNATFAYLPGATYKLLTVHDSVFTLELRLTHEYLKVRSRKTILGSSESGVAKYEFYIGVTFVTLQPYSSGVAISTAQVSLDYFKSDYVFMSIATEQSQTPVEQLDVLIHEGKSVKDGKLYQYVEFDVSYDTYKYPGVANLQSTSLRWVLRPTIAGVVDSDWSYPCNMITGQYWTGDKAALDAMATQTCLPSAPRFCTFDADKNYFFPFPTSYATATNGFLSGPDGVNNLYIQFALELTDRMGDKDLSTIFLGVDLDAWPVLQHCGDAEIDYIDVSDALKITATLGIRGSNSSAVKLKQTLSSPSGGSDKAPNRNINEISSNN
ncbi:hypothetical protein T484DRAFT_1758130 [Baffinella frigidus]|nr:hypothetical protein T484DRAFT_1758130 [Cryptophyta sp. CCMP2293]